VVETLLEFAPTALEGLFLIKRSPRVDSRGSLTRIFDAEEFVRAGAIDAVAQVNHSLTVSRGTIRGMHYQHPPHDDAKTVTCLRGRVYDVAVDIRKGSSTFLHWYGQVLEPKEGTSMLIPPGFAHGFQALVPDSELIYTHSAPYRPEAEGGLNPCDPAVGIEWPIPPGELSARDGSLPKISKDWAGVSR